MKESTKVKLVMFVGAIIISLICIFAWNNPELMRELANAQGEYVANGVVKITIDDHVYLKTDKGAMTHSESCPCKQQVITIVTNVIAVEK